MVEEMLFMGNTWVTNIRHFLDEDDELIREPGPARNLAEYLCSIVEAVTRRRHDEENWVTEIRCRRRPGHKRCKGNIIAFYKEDDLTTIQWLCSFCDDNGYITGWQNTKWDKRIFM